MSGRSSLKLGDRNEEANLRRLLVEKIDELLDMPQSGFPYFIDGKWREASETKLLSHFYVES